MRRRSSGGKLASWGPISEAAKSRSDCLMSTPLILATTASSAEAVAATQTINVEASTKANQVLTTKRFILKTPKALYGENSNAYRVRALGEFPTADDETVI